MIRSPALEILRSPAADPRRKCIQAVGRGVAGSGDSGGQQGVSGWVKSLRLRLPLLRNVWVPHAPCVARRPATLGAGTVATSDTAPCSSRPVPTCSNDRLLLRQILIGFWPSNPHAYWLIQLPFRPGTTSRNSEEVRPTQQEQRCGWFRLTGRPKLLHRQPRDPQFQPKIGRRCPAALRAGQGSENF